MRDSCTEFQQHRRARHERPIALRRRNFSPPKKSELDVIWESGSRPRMALAVTADEHPEAFRTDRGIVAAWFVPMMSSVLLLAAKRAKARLAL